jgi:hypothetical protein
VLEFPANPAIQSDSGNQGNPNMPGKWLKTPVLMSEERVFHFMKMAHHVA